MTTTGQKVKDVIDGSVVKSKGLAKEAKELVNKGTDRAKEAARSIGKAVEKAGRKIEDSVKHEPPKQP